MPVFPSQVPYRHSRRVRGTAAAAAMCNIRIALRPALIRRTAYPSLSGVVFSSGIPASLYRIGLLLAVPYIRGLMVEVMTFFFFLYGFSHPRHHHCESFFFLLFFSTFFFFRTVQTPPPLPTTPPGKRNTASLHRRHDVVFMYRCAQSPRGYRLYSIRPFLMQSDSASRKRPFSTGIFWSFFLSSVESIL